METVALPSEQFYLTTELSNVVGTSFIFVMSFGRYPCRRWYAFSSGKFSAHRLRILTVRSPWSVTALSTAHFSSTAVREPAVYRTISNTVGLQRELRYCDRFLKSHCFCFDFQPSCLGQNSGQLFDQCFVFGLPFTFLLKTCFLHLNSSFINLKSILTP